MIKRKPRAARLPIKTMGSITEPPEILGKLIGGALVGTFLGVLLCYGFVRPMAAALNSPLIKSAPSDSLVP